MTKTKSTKSALLLSAISLLMCVSMLVGSTFAWFTDSVTTGLNKIQSGNLDVDLYYWDMSMGAGADFISLGKNPDTKLFKNVDGEDILWEPNASGFGQFTVANEGTLALKYELKLNFANATATPTGKTLADVLTVYAISRRGETGEDDKMEDAKLEDLRTNGMDTLIDGYEDVALKDFILTGYLLPGESFTYELGVNWNQSDNDNEFNVKGGLSMDFGVTLLATQMTYEEDAYGDQYDVDAVIDLATAFAAGGLVKLTEDIESNATLVVPEGVEVVLDLNGKTLSGTTVKQVPVIINNGTLTVKGGTISSTGACGGAAIVNNGTAVVTDVTLNGAKFGGFDGWWPSYAMNNSGDATLTNVTINSYHGAISAYNGANVVLNNVTVDVGQDTTTNQTSWALYAFDNGTITVNSGSYIMTKVEPNVNGGGVLCTDATGAIIVNGGTFIKEGSLNNGGPIYVKDNTLTVYGGTFNADPTAYVDDGYVVVDNADGTWTVNGNFVSASTVTELTDAMNADKNVSLTEDVTVNSTDAMSTYYGLSTDGGIDGNGKTITDNSGVQYAGIYAGGPYVKNFTLNTNSLFGIYSNAKYNAIKVENVTVNKTSNSSAFYTQNSPYGVTFENVTMTAPGIGANAGAADGVVFATGASGADTLVTINSGTYTATAANGNVISSFYSKATVTVNGGTFTGNLYAVDGGNIVINGGTFNGDFNVIGGNIVINGGTFSVDPTDYVTAGKTVTDNGNGTWTVA